MPTEKLVLQRPTRRFVGILVSVLAVLCTPVPARTGEPHWISGTKANERNWHFKQVLSLEKPLQSAELKLAADFCTASVAINGQQVLTVEPYSPRQQLDVLNHLRRGKNELAIKTTAVEGPAAVALSIALVDQDGRRTTLATDETWPGAVSLGKVPPEQWDLGRRAATISPLDNYEQWRQATSDSSDRPPKFWAAPGFEITRIRKAADDEGSWIALAFDAAGRATISREDTGLLRMTLADDRRSVMRVEPIRVDLPECRGLLYLDDWLYANANNAKSLYRLLIRENGQAHDLERLREFPGGVGHGRNDLAIGPDGLIYSIHGDSVQAPGKPVLDRTSPLRDSRRGATQQEGYVARADRDGKNWELLCTGLRNPYGIAFHPQGDLFTYDADNEYDMGMPWYRPTRVVQLVSGADYGYRVSQGRWPPYFPDRPDNGLPTIDVGRGSPTAVMFGTKLNYPPAYREALFVLDWSYGRILAVHLAPRGAGYRAALELFVQGIPLNVTDVAAGPDGAMWLITGGRKTQSALYRVAFTGQVAPRSEQGRHERDAAELSQRQRALRVKLEGLHGRTEKESALQGWPHLDDADPQVRHAARIAVEHLPPGDLLARFADSVKTGTTGHTKHPVRGELEFLLAVILTGEASAVPLLVDRLLKLRADKLDLRDLFTVVFLHRECLALAPTQIAPRREAVIRQLVEFWPNLAQEGNRVCPLGDSAELRRRLASLLADLGDDGIVERVTGSMFTSPTQEDRLQGLLALRSVRRGWTEATRRRYFETLRESTHFSGGEGLPTFLDRLRSDAVAALGDDERRKLADLLAPPKVDEEPLPAPRPKVKEWSLEDLAGAIDGATRGNAEAGAKVFREALCSRCHRAGLTGPAVGPDLTFAARRFSRRDMLESIIAPSRSVAENYRNVSIVTLAGEVYVGRLVNEGDFRSEKLRLSTDALRPGQIVEIDKKQIDQQRPHDTSPMPQGLLDTFSRDEIADLLTFLEEGLGKSK